MPQRQILFRTIGRVFTGLSDTSKAFLIILITGGWQPAAGQCAAAAAAAAAADVGGSAIRLCSRAATRCRCQLGLLAAGTTAPPSSCNLLPCNPAPRACHSPSPLSPPAPDILLGYHSEEGWTATLRILSGHYGLEAEVRWRWLAGGGWESGVGMVAA